MDANEQRELEQYRQQAESATVAAAVAGSLAGRNLNPGSGELLTRLFQKDIRIAVVDGQRVALGPGGQSVRDYVSGELAKPQYQPFLGPNDRGPASPAAAAGGGAPVGTGPGGAPATLAEAIHMKLAETKRTPGDWRLDRSRPMPTEPEKR